jgi:phospholipid/cholesterol/gamma-HCH transport system substrate-binding protein
MPSPQFVAWAKFRVAVAAVTALAILSVLVYLLTGGTLLTTKATLFLYIPDATGLGSGSPVEVNGTGVGKVDTVVLSGSSEPNRVVRVTMSVELDRLADIPVDSTAQISSEGLADDKVVAITQGTAAARVRPNTEIAYKAAPELLKTIDVQQFAQQLRQADATLTAIEQGTSPAGQLVVGTDMYNGLRKALTEADRDFREAVSTTSALGKVVGSDQLYHRIYDPLVQLDNRLARLQAGQDQFGRLLRDDSQYAKLRDQTAGLRQSIATFRTQPFLTSDALYASWSRSLSSIIASVDRINVSPMLQNSSDYENLNGLLATMRSSIHEFRDDPKKFLRIQLF